jgi:hypothetical protein
MGQSGLFLTACIAAFGLTASAALAGDITRVGDLELHCMAAPTTELTPEAAKTYNVIPSPDRGLLTVTLLRKNGPGAARSLAGQVYAGAINQSNQITSIPIREVREGNEVYYLGEYRVKPPDTLRFLVNANVLGKMMKTEFSRGFAAP